MLKLLTMQKLKADEACLSSKKLNSEKMAAGAYYNHKTWETMFKFHHFTGFFLIALVAVVIYLTREITYWNVVKEQPTTTVIIKEESTRQPCDYYTGRWIYDNVTYPLYEERQCSFMEGTFACETYGRKDLKYQNWRWQPDHCDVPRFDADAFLEKLRGKKLIIVGDSMNRNLYISLLCLVEPSLSPSTPKSVKVRNNSLVLHDDGYNATLEFYWSPFLVESNCDVIFEHRMQDRVVRINSIEKHARYWSDADILIFDSYSWWLVPTLKLTWGPLGSPDSVYKTVEMKQRRYEVALNTWAEWLEFNINRTRTKMFFMSPSPYVTRNDVERFCYNRSEPLSMETYSGRSKGSLTDIIESTLQKLEKRGVKVEYIRGSQMGDYRVDAHPSIYKKFTFEITEENRRDPTSYADCLHWCLPGVPDVLNQILYAYIMRT